MTFDKISGAASDRLMSGTGMTRRDIAKYERRLVVLGIPYDLQKLDSGHTASEHLSSKWSCAP